MTADITAEKAALRRQLRQQRHAITPEQHDQAGQTLMRIIQQRWPHDHLAAYVNAGSEVPTMSLLAARWREGVGVWLPQVTGSTLRWCHVRDRQQLHRGYRGILEPDPACCPRQDSPEGAKVMLVPGLGFSHSGARLGQGGGFYDRILPAARARGVYCLGVAFACQLRAELPTEAHDAVLDEVLVCDG
ncbi:MAG: 5-formyltetrahydrofolate cyclo-ligase [Planctomycetota bacterium]|nr:MAG: 5-formyltetrahydrofolate cyclo-ligase [Planctomycetota bacterium]